MRLTLALTLAGSLAITGSSGAQDHLRVGVTGGVQTGSQTVSQNFTFPLYRENATVVNDIGVSGGGFVDLGASFRVAGPLWAGAAFSSLSRTTESALAATLPHPFFFNMPRTVNGRVSGLESKESAVHLSAAFLVPLSDKLDVAIFGGPSRFGIRQMLVTGVDYSESYPFDAASFTSASTTRASASAWGFNLGVDGSWRLSKGLAAAGLLRYAKGTTTLDTETVHGVSIDAGGVMAGAGLRIIF